MTTRRAPGSLETEVLRRLWDADGPLTSRQLRESFPTDTRPALTTVLTVLSRLEVKQLVGRRDAVGGSVFTASRPEAEQVAGSMNSLLQRVANREAVLARFAGSLDEQDTAALRRALGVPD